jgi:hypothetical protein
VSRSSQTPGVDGRELLLGQQEGGAEVGQDGCDEVGVVLAADGDEQGADAVGDRPDEPDSAFRLDALT